MSPRASASSRRSPIPGPRSPPSPVSPCSPGAPAIVGIWLGSLSYAPHWSALALAIGAGAILQVIVEVGAYLMRSAAKQGAAWLSPSTLAGIIVGIGVMYVTAMLVKI